MKIIEKKENKIVFNMEIEESLANAMRRYVNEIPIIAIDNVEIHKNDSPLYDEAIAHRLGLIPLKMDKSFDEKKSIKMKISVKKPGHVYSKELRGEADIVYGNIPITILNEDQELKLIAEARIGRGSEHNKFSPGFIFYRNLPNIEIEKDCNLCGDCIKSCPRDIFKIENKKIIIDNQKCDMCEVCINICKETGKDVIKITPTKELVISVESFGQIDIKEILRGAVKELKRDLMNLSKEVSKA